MSNGPKMMTTKKRRTADVMLPLQPCKLQPPVVTLPVIIAVVQGPDTEKIARDKCVVPVKCDVVREKHRYLYCVLSLQIK